MTSLELLAIFAQVCLLSTLGLGATWFARRAPASTRRFVLIATLGAILILPLARTVAPRWELWPATARLASPALPLFDDPVVAGPTAAANAPPAAAPPSAERSTGWQAPELVWIWLAGAALFGLRALRAHQRARRLRERSTPLCAAIGLAELCTAARRHGIAAPGVHVTSELAVPAVVGLLRPTVLVPPDAAGWQRARWQSVLTHELAHVASRDVWVNALSDLACALHWANPLVWLVARRLRFEQELAADDRVLGAGVRASEYATHLLEAVRRSDSGVAPALVLRSSLARRVEALLDRSRERSPLRPLRALLLSAGAVAALAAVACAAPAERETDSSPPATASASSPVSTLVPELQAIAEDETNRIVRELSPSSVTAIVIDPKDGAILAVTGRANALDRSYTPGSTFKLLTIAAALQERVVRPDQSFACGRRAYGDRTLTDVGDFGTLTLPEIVAVSSNVGVSHVFDALGPERFGRWLARFHLDAPSPIPGGLPGAVLAIGQKHPLRPIQIAAIYATIANGGRYNAPTLVRTRPPENEPVLSPDTARILREMLEKVVTDPRGTSRAAAVPGIRIAGKTGTADVGAGRQYASFAGIVPADAPRWVVFVGIEGAADRVTGGRAAAPAFARIAARIAAR